MKTNRFRGILVTFGIGVAALISGDLALFGAEAPTKNTVAAGRVREPAVAGLFYPRDAEALRKSIDALLLAATNQPLGGLRAIVCPHAGYVFSGRTAAKAYQAGSGMEFDTVIILGPSHYAAFAGVSIPTVEAYRTPLGLVEISAKARALAQIKPFQFEPTCRVQRPSWWSQSSKTAPPVGADAPDTWEHSIEVQVPFIQRVWPKSKILPLVLGEVNPEDVARGLANFLDPKTLIVVSTDLSHYHPEDQARKLDNNCVQAVCGLDLDAMKSQEACGKTPLLALMHLAKRNGWTSQKLDYRHSGEVTGDASGVVGYAAIAFVEPPSGPYSHAEQRQLLELARRTLTEVVRQGRLPTVDAATLPRSFVDAKGCFVTLTKNGVLRGCIGDILPRNSLFQSVVDNARNAATRDPRFSPVKPEELDQITIEVSVLTEPKPLEFGSPTELLAKLRPHQDGVVLQLGGNVATYLPQVWEQLPDKVQFLDSLSQKAGCAPGAWRNPEVKILTYQVQACKETPLKAINQN